VAALQMGSDDREGGAAFFRVGVGGGGCGVDRGRRSQQAATEFALSGFPDR
jgi:hypothetical protein